MKHEPNSRVLRAFCATGQPVLLPGGEGRTFRAGDIIIKHIGDDSREYTSWHADLFNGIKEDGFRVSRPIATRHGEWITDDGWTAWTFLEGDHATSEDELDAAIKAIRAFHAAIAHYPKPGFLDRDDSPFIRADRYAWGDRPARVHPALEAQVDALYALRAPIDHLRPQLIHGDLNPENILLTPSLPPAIIDMPPYWRPAEFALAIYAYWAGPWRDRPDALTKFPDTPEFRQLLVRAAIRMLLIMSEFNHIHDEGGYQRATEIVTDVVAHSS